MSLGLKPFPETGVEAQNLTLTAVLGDSVDRVGEALAALQKAHPDETRSLMGRQDCSVIAQTAMHPVSFLRVGGFVRTAAGTEVTGQDDRPRVTLTPPNEVFEVRFREPDPELQLDRLISTAERIRNILAFCLGSPVPLAVRLASGRFLHFVRMDAPIMASAPREAVQGDEKVAEAWYASIRAQYDMARRLLVENRPPEPISRAASLVGEGICSSDLEERFFYSWRALEVVGHWDLRVARDRASRGNDELARKYLEMASGPLLDGQKMQFDELRLIEISLAVRAFDVPNRRVGELKALRDAIAHGKVTAEDHLRIVKASGEILGVAHAVVASTLDSPVLLGTD